MSAHQIIDELTREGVVLSAEGDKLKWRGPKAAMTAERLQMLKSVKPELIKFLHLKAPERPSCEWDKEDWIAFYEERAAIHEYDNSLPREKANAAALSESVSEYLVQLGPEHLDSEICLQCRSEGHGQRVPVIFAGRADLWVHADCAVERNKRRYQEAESALKSMGVGK